MLLRTRLDDPLAERLAVDADRYERTVAAHARVLLRKALDIPFPSPGNPIGIVNCYIDGGIAPILTRWSNQGIGTNSAIYNVSYIGNRFGDASAYGRECDFQGMDVTFDAAYAKANPSVIYWARDNVWAPNGEGVTNSAKAPSGDASAGLPHTPGSFIDQRNFFGGEMFVWNGRVRSYTNPHND